jgi:hypothetical protein
MTTKYGTTDLAPAVSFPLVRKTANMPQISITTLPPVSTIRLSKVTSLPTFNWSSQHYA